MRYNCNDIKYYLDHVDQEPENLQEFLNHIENCANCSRIVSLEPDMEEILAVSTPKSSPLSIEKDILPRILENEKEYAKRNRLEKAFLPIFLFFSALPLFLGAWLWKDIRSYFNSLDLTGAYNSLQSFISEIPIPEIDLAGIAATLTNSPLIILSFITITTLVWAFSIIEAQKALK
ncbi:MAG: hypothetical protein JSU85_09900 [Candidatus Zixiibacteriota bacterium]|nr:MAG: hypothetical protein JSU85_09900 [candidate division Zixibacteria bacterium]